MIDGLKLTFDGDELRRLLHERAERHRSEIERLKTDQGPERQDSVNGCILPQHMVDGMIERHEWRSEILDFIYAHVDAAETYRLGVEDLEFAELLPETPAVVEQEEYETRTGLAFQVGRLAQALSRLQHGAFTLRLADPEPGADAPDAP